MLSMGLFWRKWIFHSLFTYVIVNTASISILFEYTLYMAFCTIWPRDWMHNYQVQVYVLECCCNRFCKSVSQGLCMLIQVLHFPHFLSFSFLPSLLRVVIKLPCVLVNLFTKKESPCLAVTVCLYACPISKEFAYTQFGSRWFEITQRYI